MGAVYLAEDSHLGRKIALKIPWFDSTESPQRAERFVREARSAAVLHHPNICTVYDAGQIEGRPYISMAMIEGQPLDDRINPDRPMPQAEAIRLTRLIALALLEAHERGIVHRDLKPGNVMLNSRGDPVVMDFGLAKRVTDSVTPSHREVASVTDVLAADSMRNDKEARLTQDGSVLGTPAYMAPEQVRGDIADIGPHSDVYALGVMLFEMLTGTLPYKGSIGIIMGRILNAPVPLVTEFRPDVDPMLDAVCRRAMSKSIGDRYLSMASFAAALDLCLQTAPEPFASLTATEQSGSPLPAIHPLRTMSVASRPVKPRRWLWPAGIVTSILFGSLVIMLFAKSSQRDDIVVEKDVPLIPTVLPDKANSATHADPPRIVAPPKPIIVPAADQLRRAKLSPDTLKFLGWGDPSTVPTELVGVLGDTTNRMPTGVSLPAFTPDGQFFVAQSGSTLGFFDWSSGKLDHVVRIPGLRGAMHRVVISPDGKLFAGRMMFPFAVAVGEVQTGKLKITLDDYELGYSQPFLPDGRGIMVVKNGTTQALCVSTTDGSVIGRPPVTGTYPGFRPTADGREMVGLTGKTITIFSTDDFKARKTIPFGAEGNYQTVEFDPRGRRLLVAANLRWEAFEWPSLTPIGSANVPAEFATFDPTGEHVWATTHGVGKDRAEFGCYSVTTGTKVRKSVLDAWNGWAFWAVTPDRKGIAVIAGQNQRLLTRINTETGVVNAPRIGHTGPSHVVSVSPDGTTAATGSDDLTVRTWDLATGREQSALHGHPDVVYWIEHSPDGKLIASADLSGVVIVTNAAGLEKCRFQFTAKRDTCPAFTPDGAAIVVGLLDGRLGFFDSSTGALIRTTGRLTDNQRVRLTYSPDGRTLAIAGSDTQVRLADPVTGETVRTLTSRSPGEFLQFTADGKYLFLGHQNPIRRWDVATGEAIDISIPGALFGMAVQPGGGLVATGGVDGMIHLADPTDPARMPVALPACTGGICSRVAFTPDGRHLLAPSQGGQVCVFRLPNTPSEIADWFDRKADEAGLPHRRITYTADQLKAGQIKAPDFSKRKKIFESDFTAPSKDFPSTSPDKFPRVEGGKYLMDNSSGALISTIANGKQIRDTRLAIPGEHTAFGFEIKISQSPPEPGWSVMIRDEKQTIELTMHLPGVTVTSGRRFQNPKFLAQGLRSVPKDLMTPRRLLVLSQGRTLEVYVDGTLACNPIYLDAPIAKAKLEVAITGSTTMRLDIDRITIFEVPPLAKASSEDK